MVIHITSFTSLRPPSFLFRLAVTCSIYAIFSIMERNRGVTILRRIAYSRIAGLWSLSHLSGEASPKNHTRSLLLDGIVRTACTCSQFRKGSAPGAAFPGFRWLYPLRHASGPGYKERLMTFLGAWMAITPGNPE